MFERLNGPARRVLHLAHREATLLGHDYLGTEHLLQGLVREGSPLVVGMLAACAVRPEDVSAALERDFEPRPDSPGLDKLPLTAAVKRVLGRAGEYANAQATTCPSAGSIHVGPEHLLCALLDEADCDATRTLETLGVERGPLENYLRSHTGNEEQDRMVHAGVPSASARGRDPSIDDLESLLTADPLPAALVKARPPQPSLTEDLMRAEQHLRNLQLVFGAVLGILCGTQLFEEKGLAIGLVLGIVVASFQNSLVGAIVFGVAGALIGRRYDPAMALIGLGAGAFLGSWLGQMWRPKKTAPHVFEKDEES